MLQDINESCVYVRVYWSQSSAPPHNLEVDYDFNDFLFLLSLGREPTQENSIFIKKGNFPAAILSTCQ